jgi:hypothetical protein
MTKEAERKKKEPESRKKEAEFKKVAVTCTGVSALLLNPMTPEILKTLPGSGISAGARKMREEITPEDMAESKVLRNKKDEMGIPVEYLFACLVAAGRKVPLEKKTNISTAETTLLPSFLSIEAEGDFIPFLDQTVVWETDIRRVVNKTTKGAMAAVRPKFRSWSFRVVIEVDVAEIGLDKIQQLFRVAGKTQGLGDFRPSKKGQFGRFALTAWEVVEMALANAA